MLEEVTKDFSNVSVKTFEGLTIDFAKQNDAKLIIRGLRAVTDFESEMQIAQTNHSIEPEIDTMFFTTRKLLIMALMFHVLFRRLWQRRLEESTIINCPWQI